VDPAGIGLEVSVCEEFARHLDQDAKLFESKVRLVFPSVDHCEIRRYDWTVYGVLGDWTHFHRTPHFLYAFVLTP
jgi:hypothetical protein